MSTGSYQTVVLLGKQNPFLRDAKKVRRLVTQDVSLRKEGRHTCSRVWDDVWRALAGGRRSIRCHGTALNRAV